MRILYFSRDYTTHDRRFLAAMSDSHHEIAFLRLEDDGITYEPRALPERVRPVRWRGASSPSTPASCLALMRELERVLREVDAHLVHAGPIQLCSFMIALAGIRPLMSMSWGSDILVDAHRSPELAWATEFALKRSDYVLCDCDAVREQVGRVVPLPADRFVQLPWGLDLDQFSARSAAQIDPRPSDTITILSTRSWGEIYCIDVVLDAFAAAHRSDRRLRLRLVGDGPLAPMVHTRIRKHGLESVVALPGRLDQGALRSEFEKADVYLSCALSDGTSVSLLEAMASGIPVIVTDAPGNREWVTPHEGGWLAPPKDAQAFAEALLQAASLSPAARANVSAFNRAIVEDRADWSKNTRRLIDAYDRIERSR